MRKYAIGGVATLLGLVLWLSSPTLVGTPEPWASSERTYLVLLFFSGAVLGFFEPRDFWVAPAGLYLGQLLAILIQAILGGSSSGEPLALKPLFLITYSLFSLVGAALTGGVRHWRAGSPDRAAEQALETDGASRRPRW